MATIAETAPVAQQSIRLPQPVARNVAVDAYRGFVMLLMMAEVLQLSRVARPSRATGSGAFWPTTRPTWSGPAARCTIPSSRGFRFWWAWRCPTRSPAAWRRAERSARCSRTRCGGRCCWSRWASSCAPCTAPRPTSRSKIRSRRSASAIRSCSCSASVRRAGSGPRSAVILTGYWLAWALYPVPGPGFDYQAVGVPPDWQHHYTGFAAHWNKNANLGNAFDQWFLNLFPRTTPFVANGGGYLTLSFIPTLGTMILGLVAGRWLRAAAPQDPDETPAARGRHRASPPALLLHFTGICPVVKRIWTPSWTLFSGGVVFPVPGGLQLGDRREGLPEMGLSAGGDRDEFHRGLPDRAPVRAASSWSSFRIHLGPHAFQFFGPGSSRSCRARRCCSLIG